MKKILSVLIAALALTQSVRAELVTPERAAQSARGFMGMKTAPVRENISPRRAAGLNGQENAPEYYIFNNPDGGWIIIAGDDRVNPVIGYSLEGSFSVADMSDDLKWWMDGVAEYVDIIRSSDMVATPSVKAAWASIVNGAPESEKKEMVTAKWHQQSPYNNLCPVVTGENERSVTGCVATAMAIIMQYNKWPVHGKGVIGGYTSNYINTYIPAYSIEGHNYDWDLMSEDNVVKGTTGTMTSEQIYQVARLMYDCGVSVQMNFSSTGSGTQTGLVSEALKKHMSYSESVTNITRSSYNLDDWFAILKNEIDNDRVVLYAGSGEGGGHAFVCDGYDTQGHMVHINWGWGSADINGYYTLNLELPKRYGDGFSDNQQAVIGIAPDTTTVVLDAKSALSCALFDNIYGIEPYYPTDMKSGTEVWFYLGWFKNEVDRDITREFKVCLLDKDGNVKQEGWHMSLDFPSSNGYFYGDKTETNVLEVDPDLTDYFKVFYKNDDDVWVPMVGNYDILPNVDGLVCGVTPDPYIIVPENCTAGQNKMSLTYGFTHVKSVKWSVNGTEFEGDEVTLVTGKNEIRAEVEYLDGSNGYISRTVNVE